MLNVEMIKLRKYLRKNRTRCVALMEARWDAFHHSAIPRSGAWPLPPPHRHTHTITSHHLKISVSHSIPRRPLLVLTIQYIHKHLGKPSTKNNSQYSIKHAIYVKNQKSIEVFGLYFFSFHPKMSLFIVLESKFKLYFIPICRETIFYFFGRLPLHYFRCENTQ